KITDPDDTVLFTKDLTTSRFGIAATEWTIPESTRLGDYRLNFETEEEDESSAIIKISSNKLTNFTINVKPDRSYYLTGQNPTIKVRADYIFDKPVLRGHVRVVRETERTWNYREQKYKTNEGDQYEGEAGTDNAFTAQIDLTKDHAELKDENYRRFQDVPYVAYVTDPTTKRTEQRRFNIRLTKE